jgi:hypothetical protein
MVAEELDHFGDMTLLFDEQLYFGTAIDSM